MKHLSTLNKYFWKYRWHFMLGILFVVLTNYFRILSPQLTGYVVNTVVHTIKDGDSATVNSAKADEKNYDVAVRAVIKKFDQTNSRPHKILFAGLTLLVLAIISGFFMRSNFFVITQFTQYFSC